MSKHTPGQLGVYYGADTVGVWPAWSKNNSLKDAVIGPLPRSPENIHYCNTIAAAPETAAERDRLKAEVAELRAALEDACLHLDRAETTLISASRGRLTPDQINDAGYEAGAAVNRARALINRMVPK